MSNQVTRHLSTLSSEIADARAHLTRLRERLETQCVTLEESRIRMLIAETPLADRELHAAAEGYLRLEREVRDVEAALETLRHEQDLLAARAAALT